MSSELNLTISYSNLVFTQGNNIPIDPALNHDSGVMSTVLGLSDALNKLKLNRSTVLLINIPTVEELLKISDKKVTEAELTDKEILEQIEYDRKEANREHVPELEAPEPEPEPLISYSEAICTLAKLNTLFQSETGPDFTEAKVLLPKLTRTLCKKCNNTLEQADICSFFV